MPKPDRRLVPIVSLDVVGYSRLVSHSEAQTLRLVEAKTLGGTEVGGRRPFSLIFEGPGGAPLAQQTYRFEQAAFDVLEMFIVPVGQGASGIQYQAVFN